MWAHDTGQMEAIHLPLLSVEDVSDIHSTIETVANCSNGEGRITFNILKGGIISAIDMMVRKIRKPRKK